MHLPQVSNFLLPIYYSPQFPRHLPGLIAVEQPGPQHRLPGHSLQTTQVGINTLFEAVHLLGLLSLPPCITSVGPSVLHQTLFYENTHRVFNKRRPSD